MHIKLVFDDWRKRGESIYATPDGVALSSRDFHSGTTFNGTIELDAEQAKELVRTLEAGYQPVFWLARHLTPVAGDGATVCDVCFMRVMEGFRECARWPRWAAPRLNLSVRPQSRGRGGSRDWTGYCRPPVR